MELDLELVVMHESPIFFDCLESCPEATSRGTVLGLFSCISGPSAPCDSQSHLHAVSWVHIHKPDVLSLCIEYCWWLGTQLESFELWLTPIWIERIPLLLCFPIKSINSRWLMTKLVAQKDPAVNISSCSIHSLTTHFKILNVALWKEKRLEDFSIYPYNANTSRRNHGQGTCQIYWPCTELSIPVLFYLMYLSLILQMRKPRPREAQEMCPIVKARQWTLWTVLSFQTVSPCLLPPPPSLHHYLCGLVHWAVWGLPV